MQLFCAYICGTLIALSLQKCFPPVRLFTLFLLTLCVFFSVVQHDVCMCLCVCSVSIRILFHFFRSYVCVSLMVLLVEASFVFKTFVLASNFFFINLLSHFVAIFHLFCLAAELKRQQQNEVRK